MHRKKYVYIALFLIIASLAQATKVWAISWKDNLDIALKEAKQHQVPVMIDFYTNWCRWCKELDRNTYSDGNINELSTHFICVKLDAEKYPEAAVKYSVTGYPTIVFLNKDGSVNSRIIGYRDAGPFRKAMESVLKMAGGSAKNTAPVNNDSMELSGIIFNKQKTPVAIINNAFVKEGDVIGKGKVSKITKDKVEVLFAEKTVTLKLD